MWGRGSAPLRFEVLRISLKFLASLKLTVFLLVAFLLVIFWGVLGQANVEAAGMPADLAVDRFFGSYFVWVFDVVPVPAMKSLAVLACVNLVAAMGFMESISPCWCCVREALWAALSSKTTTVTRT